MTACNKIPMSVYVGGSDSTEKLSVKWLFLRAPPKGNIWPMQLQWFPYHDGQECPGWQANPQKNTLSQKKDTVATNIWKQD